MNIFELADTWQKDRRTLDEHNSDPINAMMLLLGEVDELRDEFRAFQQGTSDKERVSREVSDVLLYCLTLFRALGIDADEAVREKIARNHLKHPSHRFNNGISFEEAIRLNREEWTTNHEQAFYADCQRSRENV